jgi:dephospho-CoA kinase
MRVIGLTGGIGTGKSAVSRLLREKGVTVIDADEATRAVEAPGSAGLRRLAEEFGDWVLTPDGALDRHRLAAVAFKDPEARQRLNGIIHPLVREWMADRQAEAEARGEAYAVLDIPLLYESRGAAAFEDVILVYAPDAVALRRLVEQRGMTEEEARSRMAAQLPIEEKRGLAPYVIDNSGTLEQLRAETERVWAQVTGRRGAAAP